ncbi:helix-turn-helix domain-containing protein [Cupriavidus necator]|uniref:helix-turn-helix domain-containing protein n=1 Tax=Cupriavidus necator TaxID=106590 RepID=UPI001490716D|nr:helix-turn-helix domain-containing protein [Cupriavidus necator]NOV27668.1 helix-turn-helix domain-containing protein [Cupriavidus necator]
MKTTLEFLEAVRARLGGASDYAIAKELGVTRAAVSRYRNGLSGFDDDTAIRVARILDIDPACVLLAAHAERTKTPEARNVFAALADRFALNFEALLNSMGQRRSPALA